MAQEPFLSILISRKKRDQLLKSHHFEYGAEPLAFGRIELATFGAVQQLAALYNQMAQEAGLTERAVPSEVAAFGTLHRVLESIAGRYDARVAPECFHELEAHLQSEMGKTRYLKILSALAENLPPGSVDHGESSVDRFLTLEGEEKNREHALIALLLLWVHQQNPAAKRYLELVDPEDAIGISEPALETIVDFLQDAPPVTTMSGALVDTLMAPIKAAPHSLSGQLSFILSSYETLLSDKMKQRILRSLDHVKETEKWGLPGPGPVQAPVFEHQTTEEVGRGDSWKDRSEEEWMTSLVLIAKNTYVWLHQLGRRFERDIRRLDEVPDEVLGELADSGFSCLWLIGLWERSTASRKIKEHTGSLGTMSSAYSLARYTIADDLGGWDALQRLRQKALAHGIRLAADMVPNHTGILSDWIIEHPDWFLQLDYPPYPAYTFNGPNLSDDPRVEIYIEDGYYDHSDAAVVFKHVDCGTGRVRYIYHGNDGTQMPWNDTAQLNFLNADVRREVMENILNVAKSFAVIRFDAAMTLTKYHYQRLWFPKPGDGGAIPSRSEHGLAQQQYDNAMPTEFWRDVVDTSAARKIDSLFVAEAFWLTESFFIRNLAMHRVYNSAFMNMLKDEKNPQFRRYLQQVLDVDVDVLGRFVNFMTNPDEETAVVQFGTGDKYTGAAILLATMPGLPMFGHGQVEGISEKYGMEFDRDYWNEPVDDGLLDWHRQRIFPLLRHRRDFASTRDFYLFDFEKDDGSLDENVIAYSNQTANDGLLVIYNNCLDSTKGSIKTSTSRLTDGEPKRISLLQAVGAAKGSDWFQPGLDSYEIHETDGLSFELQGYESRVFRFPK